MTAYGAIRPIPIRAGMAQSGGLPTFVDFFDKRLSRANSGHSGRRDPNRRVLLKAGKMPHNESV
jgi:hypothetical protein